MGVNPLREASESGLLDSGRIVLRTAANLTELGGCGVFIARHMLRIRAAPDPEGGGWMCMKGRPARGRNRASYLASVAFPLCPLAIVGTPVLESHTTTTQLSYQGETLAQAVSELNRHNHRRRLVIADREIADVKLSGHFDATDPESFVAALAPLGVFSLSSRRKDDEIRLVGPRGLRR
jgi:hypothetical protein